MSESQVKPPTRIAIIVNPRAGNGRARRNLERLLPTIQSTLDIPFEVFETSGPGDATALTRRALRDGFDRIVSAGGDGTHFEVLNGFFDGETRLSPTASMALLPIGTASDLRHTLDLPEAREAAAHLATTNTALCDMGRLTATGLDGERATHYFHTSVHAGIGGLVAEHTNRRSKAMGSFLTYLLGLITARLAWRNVPMKVSIDGLEISEDLMEVIAANGRYDGGGMNVAPESLLDDGLLDVYVVGKLGILGTLMNIPRIYRGTHGDHPAVRFYRAAKIEITSPEKVFVSPDGELAGTLPVTIKAIPKAIRIAVGPGAPFSSDG